MKGRSIHYSNKERSFIKDNCTMARRDLHRQFCNKFNRNDVSLINLNSLCKKNGWLTGRTGCFEKGHAPHPNAGSKGPNKTSFKKGHTPKNTKQIGSERICSKDGFILIKVSEKNPHTGALTRYKHKHVHVWEQANGKVPPEHVVTFIDGNKLNCTPSNLKLITRAELLYLNKNDHANIPPAMKETMYAVAKLETTANRLGK